MSIKVMTLVWDNFPGNGSELLTMLALADWCNDAGGSLHPSISTVAKKIRLSECQARRIIHGLIDQGYLSVVANHFGGDPCQTRQYKINLSMLTTSASDTPVASATPITGERDPYHRCASTPSAGDSLTTIEPSITITSSAKKRQPRHKVVFQDGEFIGIPDAVFDSWALAYPNVNAKSELRKAAAWILSNPKNRKTDYLKFLNGWLGRARPDAQAKFDPVAYINGQNRSAGNVIDADAHRVD